MHFTSVTPVHMRYMLLNVDPEDAIKLTVWYSKPNRLDVFVDGDYVQATNARTTANGNYILDMPEGMENTHTIFTLSTGTSYLLTVLFLQYLP